MTIASGLAAPDHWLELPGPDGVLMLSPALVDLWFELEELLFVNSASGQFAMLFQWYLTARSEVCTSPLDCGSGSA